MRSYRVSFLALIAGLALFISGCSGGGGDGDTQPQPQPQQRVVSGTVSNARDISDHVTAGTVRLFSGDNLTTAQNAPLVSSEIAEDGTYSLETDQSGDFTLVIEPVEGFQRTEIPIALEGAVSRLWVAVRVLSDGATSIDGVEIQPGESQILEAGSQKQFSATTTPTADASPTWTVEGDIGTISSDGIFRAASSAGEGRIRATLDGRTDSVDITIVENPPGPADQSYMPMAVGNRWDYLMTLASGLTPAQAGENQLFDYHEEVTGTVILRGTDYFLIEATRDATDEHPERVWEQIRRETGGAIYARVGNPAYDLPILMLPPQEGMTWPDPFFPEVSFTITGVGEEVTVPAGTFDCVRVEESWEQQVDDESAITNRVIGWYARGVGLVKDETWEGDVKTSMIELTEYSVQ